MGLEGSGEGSQPPAILHRCLPSTSHCISGDLQLSLHWRLLCGRREACVFGSDEGQGFPPSANCSSLLSKERIERL